MITFSNIPESVQKTLFDRMDMLDKNKRTQIGEPISTDTGSPKDNYMFSRSVFMRMISLQPPASNPRPIILSGGEADHKGNLVGNLWGKKTTNSGVASSTDDPLNPVVNHGRYWAEGDSQPYRPMPGVKDVSVEYKGGGRTLAATRVAEISWTCWTYDDLDRLTAHFLHTGNTVFIDWGWSGIGDLNPTKVEKFPILVENDDGELDFAEPYVDRKGKKVPLLSILPDHIINQNGNYDAMIGIVQDFEWSVRDDGGFDCVTTIVSTGVNILQQSLKTSSDPRLTTLPTIIKSTKTDDVDYDNKGVAVAVAGAATVAAVMWWNPIGWVSAAAATVGVLAIGGGMAYDAMFASDDHYITPTLLKEFQGEGDPVPPRSEEAAALEVKQDNIWGKDQTNTHYVGSFKGPELLKKMSPYITFDIYVKDLYNQVRNMLSLDPGVTKSGHVIRIRAKVDPGFIEKENKYESNLDKNTFWVDEMYVTWGWFEDNVLSRFFSRLTDNGQGVMGEFRSFEEAYDASGNSTENVPVKIRNHPNMLTTDLTKFLLLKSNDAIYSWVSSNWENGWEQSDKNLWHNTMFGGETFFASPLDDNGKVKLHFFDDQDEHENFKTDSGILRNVYFNVRHLADMMSDGTDIESAIRDVWRDFASEYGGIYDFYLDYSDDQNRIIVKDRGWTFDTVKKALDNKSHPENPDALKESDKPEKFDGLFEFPTWEKNSIVKSQNLSARLPDRMKLVAMYGASNLPMKEEKDSFDSSHHEDQAGLAWGQLTAPIDPELELERGDLTTEQIERKVLTAAMLGKIDYPWRNNRSFGSKTANIDKELYIQQLSGIQGGGNEVQGTGTIMYDSVIQKIMDNQYAEYIQNLREITATTTGADTVDTGKAAAEMKAIMLERKRKWINLTKLRGTPKFSAEKLFGMYQLKNSEDRPGGSLGADGYGKSHAFKLSSAFKEFMMKEIRGFTGIQANSDPIVPIDFELEVDGVAGIFPGNAFQSSYLPEKYKEISCFQTMGVNQKLDSSGWTSTIKGQIRVSVPPGTPPEPEDLPESTHPKTPTYNTSTPAGSYEIPTGLENPDGSEFMLEITTTAVDNTAVQAYYDPISEEQEEIDTALKDLLEEYKGRAIPVNKLFEAVVGPDEDQ